MCDHTRQQLAHSQARQLDGSLQEWYTRWGFSSHEDELQQLADATPRELQQPCLNEDDTPGLFWALTPLFVLMVHNTKLESYVSKHKMIEKPNMGGLAVQDAFLHHARQDSERVLLCAPGMRSETGGALKPGAKQAHTEGKRLPASHAHGSKKCRRLSVEMGLTKGRAYDHAEVYSRGDASVACEARKRQAAEATAEDAVPAKQFASLLKTAARGPSGRARVPVAPPQAKAYLAPQPGESGKGTGRSKDAIAARQREHTRAAAVAAAAPKVVPTRRNGAPMTTSQRNKEEGRGSAPPVWGLTPANRAYLKKHTPAPTAAELAAKAAAEQQAAAAKVVRVQRAIELQETAAKAADAREAARVVARQQEADTKRAELEADAQRLAEREAARQQQSARAQLQRLEAAQRKADTLRPLIKAAFRRLQQAHGVERAKDRKDLWTPALRASVAAFREAESTVLDAQLKL